jgi:hypothetical protein
MSQAPLQQGLRIVQNECQGRAQGDGGKYAPPTRVPRMELALCSNRSFGYLARPGWLAS